MIQAYKGGKIGIISNEITKIWNGITLDYYAIQVLCAKGNFAIDAAKTLYEPVIPKHIDEHVKRYTRCKVPHFFIYAKDKKKSQVEEINDSVVNRLEAIIPNSRISDKESSKGKFNYKHLMRDPNVKETQIVVNAYNELYRKHRYAFSLVKDISQFAHIRNQALISLTEATGDLVLACDMLIHYLFDTLKSNRQKVFWLCFADVVLRNLQQNLDETIYCSNCGKRFKKDVNNQKLCEECAMYQKMPDKEIVCCDCGVVFKVKGVVKNKKRCEDCQAAYNLERYRKYNKKRK
jgi:hypothetical protein